MNRWSFVYPHWTDIVTLAILVVGMGLLVWWF